ncbi:MAG TPA: undecaprenyldiphospho-muramoylpentapeptide beta-N-acetylglucosaminyltransferase [Candidatus Campbellbacteria bacterium]|nr:undecaprenyldiphospho-muramoylpentapeptide beta-N-acetylglucosaminyltransferase [Candidatus Campbellbacteria bacterium]
MKILFTGGGTGGHFYPIIAVIDAINAIIEREKIIKADFIFMSEFSYDSPLLLQKGVRFKKVSSGKIRRYFSFLNIIDIFKIILGAMKAIRNIYFDFPDVVFSKGGYSSFPAVFAARIFRIPLMVHESDVVPGKVNRWAGKFAEKIAISFPQSVKYFSEKKTALTGNPVRREFFVPAKQGAREFLDLEEGAPIILIIGGSQGAKKINDTIIDVLPELVKKYQIIHQCGKKNLAESKGRSSLMLEGSNFKSRYHIFDYLNLSALRMAYGVSDLVISRAGSGSIFEIATSGLPSILIPISNSAQDHQRKNAYAYAKIGAADVIEEINLSSHLLHSEIKRLFEEKEKMFAMAEAARKFAKPDAAEKIAREIINLVLEHA